MDLTTFLQRSPHLNRDDWAAEFATKWTPVHLPEGACLSRQEQDESGEYILLQGALVSTICDPDGREVCVDFYLSPCVVTPNIARTRDGVSRVSIVATTPASLARIDSNLLSDLMITSGRIRQWANDILSDALSAKADREWSLAALGGAARLDWFRASHPDHETIFPHTYIASFLGVTPVTLSRLRAERREE